MRAAIPIYVLNLNRSKDRLQSIERQLLRLGLSFTRVAAVDGRSGDIEEEVKAGRGTLSATARQVLTREEVGCHLSHLKAFDQILSHGVSAAFVLEDDVVLSRNFVRAAEALLEAFSDQPVIVKLEPWKKARLGLPVLALKDFDLVFARHRLCETGAYFITAPAIRSLREPLNEIRQCFDEALYADHRTGVRLLTLNPPVAVQAAAFESLIEAGRRERRGYSRENVLRRELLRPMKQLYQFADLLFAVGATYGLAALLSIRWQAVGGPGAVPIAVQRSPASSDAPSISIEGIAR